MTTTTTDTERELLTELLEKLDECAEIIRALEDRSLEATCLAEFEGRAGGWLGTFVRDEIEQALEALDDEDE